MRSLSGIRYLTRGQISLAPFFVLTILYAVAQGLSYLSLIPVIESVVEQDWDDARFAVLKLAVLAVLSAILFFAQARTGYNTSFEIMRTAQHRVGEHAASLPIGWFDQSRAGQLAHLTSRSTEDAGSVTAHLVQPLVSAVVTPTVVVVGLVWQDWRIALAGAAFLPLAALFGWLAPMVTRRVDARLDRNTVEVNEQVVDFATAQPLVRSSGRGVGDYPPLDDALEDYGRTHRRAIWLTLPGVLANAVAVQAWLVLLLAVTLTVTLGADGPSTASAAIGLLIVVVRFVDPLVELSEHSTQLRVAGDAVDRLVAMLDTPTLPEPEHPAAIPDHDLDVGLEDVRFQYSDQGAMVLERVTLRARPGTLTALVGPSGGGKTTVLRLIARFYDPPSGTVSLGGVDVRELGSASVIDRVAVVFQDVYLFDGTIRDNVRQGRPDATEAELEEAIRAARVEAIGERLPSGLDTQVGEGGAQLSGGERQRVSIARALLKDTPIVLLDEATSAVDPENEAALTDAFAALAQGRTVIAIAHQLETIQRADQILFLENGRIVESGTHDQLLAQQGRFARFWEAKQRAASWRLDDSSPSD